MTRVSWRHHTLHSLSLGVYGWIWTRQRMSYRHAYNVLMKEVCCWILPGNFLKQNVMDDGYSSGMEEAKELQVVERDEFDLWLLLFFCCFACWLDSQEFPVMPVTWRKIKDALLESSAMALQDLQWKQNGRNGKPKKKRAKPWCFFNDLKIHHKDFRVECKVP